MTYNRCCKSVISKSLGSPEQGTEFLSFPQSLLMLQSPVFSLVFYMGGIDYLGEEARSIPNIMSPSFNAQFSWQTSHGCFPYTIVTQVLPHGMQDMAVGIWFAYIGQFSWGYTTHGSRLASKNLPNQTLR